MGVMTSGQPPSSLQLGCYPYEEVGSAGASHPVEGLDVMDAEKSNTSCTTICTTVVADILESPTARGTLMEAGQWN